ncbi:ABC transporter substrate-binding protein [Kocuria sp. TGY1127_2]|uniref:ABC transporter substrate-binding protein n=1 Tax=Kocuria sp. TGY1127_2 TaxID=2711328 RepID=UPI0015BA5F57|nr:ABC transporter substrate-binding protein [Kocuria sp. TGY1127_2]
MATTRRRFLTGSLGVAALALAGCGRQPPAAPEASGSSASSETTFVFGNAAAAPTLDPSLTSNLETSRIAAQVLEPLVKADQDTGKPIPGLATDWTVSGDGLTYTFTLRQGVTFHDGTKLTADAVCRNFQRWSENTKTEQVNQTAYQAIFRSTKADGTSRPSIYRSCTASSERTVQLRISTPYPSIVKALTQPAFGIGAPSAFDDNSYASHPVGTGPFELKNWDGQTAELSRFSGYWGEAAHISKLKFVTVSSTQKRYYEILMGNIDAYDQIGIDDFVNLARRGYQIQQRDPYSVAYVSMNQQSSALSDIKVRRAVAHAITRSEIANTYYPDGTKVANDFVPELFKVSGSDTQSAYRQDQGLAKKLLEESEYNGEELQFFYPTDVSLAYVQSPEAVFAKIAGDLTSVGFNIKPMPISWSDDYLTKINESNPKRAFALTGYMGAFRDPDDFLSPLFRQENPQFGFSNSDLFEQVRKASSMSDGDDRNDLYKKINESVADLMPAVPLAFPISAVALNSRVLSYPLTATGVANFARIELRDQK